MAQWPAATQKARPWTRWWWMGSAVDSAGIISELQQFREAGIGGVEIVPIYGAKGAESRFRKYLSPGWMRMLDLSVQQAAKHDMGVYLAVGTGWPVGGPGVSTGHAATRLIVKQYDYNAGEKTLMIRVDEDKRNTSGATLAALMACNDKGDRLDITAKVASDGLLNWTPGKGTWKLYAAFTTQTGQKVKRAAPGGEGFTLDHFGAGALQEYLTAFDRAFGKDLHGVQAFYNDSYEVYGADWTPDFFNEFQKRRGYDLRLHLDLLVSEERTKAVARLKSDYRETMSDLMLDCFAKPLDRWAHEKKALSLNQAHGSPGNLLDLYAAFDIPETESFGSSPFAVKGLRRDSADIRNVDPDPDMMRFAASAAHAAGHNLVSCETFTWLGEHFKTAWSQCKPEAEQAWLAGINHIFFHGTTYSPADMAWPGWLFYASVEFDPANSLWPHLKGMNEYIIRCQSVLQSGEPDNEIMAYWPVYDAWEKAEGRDIPLRVHNVERWLYNTPFHHNIRRLREQGYAFDFVSDRMLEQMNYSEGNLQVTAAGGRSKVLLISRCRRMPLATLEHIFRIAEQGATIVLQGIPESMPGYYHTVAEIAVWEQQVALLQTAVKEGDVSILARGKGKIILAEQVEEGLHTAGLQPESLVHTGLQFIRRKVPEGKYYFLVNHTGHTIDTTITMHTVARSGLILDPQSGATGWTSVTTGEGTSAVRVQLKSGESLFLKLNTALPPSRAPAWKYYTASGPEILVNGPWKLHFTGGGPQLPQDRTLDTLADWTVWEDTRDFSGTAVYTAHFNLAGKNAGEYLLQLNGVHESARVWINGRDAGIIWANPFEAHIGKYLKPGRNQIRIEVANLMANRIRYMDLQKMSWRNYHEINFVNINYKPFDASGWEVMPSGIAGPVVIRALKEN